MNLSTYACNTEGLYFLDLLSYPEISPSFKQHYSSMTPERSYDSFELSVYYWLVALDFRIRPIRPKLEFSMGLTHLLWERGFKVPFHNWGYEVGVNL